MATERSEGHYNMPASQSNIRQKSVNALLTKNIIATWYYIASYVLGEEAHDSRVQKIKTILILVNESQAIRPILLPWQAITIAGKTLKLSVAFLLLIWKE